MIGEGAARKLVISKAQIAWSRLEVEVEAEAGGCGGSREAAQECSPWRKPWDRNEKSGSPKGAKEPFRLRATSSARTPNGLPATETPSAWCRTEAAVVAICLSLLRSL